MTRRSIGVAQTCPAPGDLATNLREHLRLVELARRLGANVLLFPELSLLGYELELAERSALLEDDARLAPLAQAASSRGITLVVGAPVRADGVLHIGALVFGATGSRALYTKQHLGAFGESARADGDGGLPPPEPSVFRPGTRDPLVELEDGLAALAICADTARPSHARRAAERGATAYLASMFVIPSEFDADSQRLGEYAAHHGMLVALANYGSATGGLGSAGQSSIWAPGGVLCARLPASGAGVAVVTPAQDGWRSESALLDGA